MSDKGLQRLLVPCENRFGGKTTTLAVVLGVFQPQLLGASVLKKIDLKWLLKTTQRERDEVMFLAFEPEYIHSVLKGLMGLKKPREIEVAVLIRRERCFYS